MNEIEVKVIDVDTESIKRKVISKGGILVKKEIQENYMYVLPPCTVNKNGFIRIRTIKDLLNGNDKIILCSKKIISQGETRQTEEHELEVSDLCECKSFLDSLNLDFKGIRKKYRESYKYMGCLVEFDTWDKTIYPDTYIEIEVADKNNIKNILKSLNIPEKNATSKSLRQIIADKKQPN